MVQLRLFGPPNLAGSGRGELLSVLSQPKRLALLAYLAMADPGGRHRRDELVGVFWPDLGEKRARNALSQAIHRLSRSLGDGIMEGKGTDEVGLNPDAFWCDVPSFQEALDRDDPEGAMTLYRGELLKGFYLSEALAFERWLEGKRADMHRRAFDALGRLAEREAEAGRLTAAVDWARKAVQLAPNNEAAVQRLIRLLSQAGDRAHAVRTYEAFARGIQAELGVDPTEETRALVAELMQPNGNGSGSAPAPAPAPASYARAPIPGPPSLPPRIPLPAPLAVLRDEVTCPSATHVRSMAVLPFAQLGPDHNGQFPTDGLHDQVISELNLNTPLTVISRTSVAMYRDLRRSIPAIANELEVDCVMEGSVFREGDRVQVNLHLFRAIPEEQLWSRTFVRRVQSVISFNSEIARAVALELQAALALARDA